MRRTSTTASLAAGIRAHHQRWNLSPIFADEYAVDMVSLGWRLIVKNRLLNWLVVDKLLAPFHPIHTENILRVLYAEECLHEAIGAGLAQYVILGAGFDTFSLRHRELQVQVFEVDHPATQRIKRERVHRVAGHIPPNLAFAPVDFEADRLDEALVRSRLDAGKPAFFSWLGTTYYLTKDAIRETLGYIAAVAAPGSRLVLDYKLPRHLIPEQGLPLNDKLERLVKRLGEPMIAEFAPGELTEEMARIGWAELESLLPQAQARRYLQDRSDIVEPPPNFAFALFGC